MKVRSPIFLCLVALSWTLLPVRAALAHGDEPSVPAKESFATAMALLQVQPDMTEMIGDKIGDGLESEDTEGVDLGLAGQAQKAFEAGNGTEALDLLARATGLTPAEAIAMQTNDAVRPSDVPIADQLATAGSAGRPSPAAIAALGVGAIFAIGMGVILARRTR